MKSYLTIELGRGATYESDEYTVYRHGEYPKYSVLAGQPKRTFVDSFETLAEAVEKYPDAEVLDDGGSTYVEMNLNYLPDEDGNTY